MDEQMTVEKVATVRVSDVVDGTVRRKGRGPGRRQPLDYHLQVDPAVMAAAQAAMRPGERLEIVSETEVRLVPADG